MTIITGNGLNWYAWLSRQKLMELELKMRPSGMRSRMLAAAWPGIREALGMKHAKMTEKALRETIEVCSAKVSAAEKEILDGDIRP
jgi:hypothetical protein